LADLFLLVLAREHLIGYKVSFQGFQAKRLKHFDEMIAKGYIGNRIMIYEKE